MNDSSTLLSGFLFVATLALAAALMVVPAGAPYLLPQVAEPPDMLLLFARDMTVRRTSFFCALGLIATSFVFFRPSALKKRKSKEPPVNMTGA